MITEYDFIFGAGGVAFLALLCLAAILFPDDADDPDGETSWLTERDLDDEEDDDLDHVRVDRGVLR